MVENYSFLLDLITRINKFNCNWENVEINDICFIFNNKNILDFLFKHVDKNYKFANDWLLMDFFLYFCKCPIMVEYIFNTYTEFLNDHVKYEIFDNMSLDFIPIFVKAGLINKKFGSQYQTMLIWASIYNLDSITKLIENGADVNIKDKLGNNVLHYLLNTVNEEDNGIFDIVKYLVEKCHINVNAQNNKGETPLFNITSTLFKLVEYLINSGADITILDYEGYSTFHRILCAVSTIEQMKFIINKGKAVLNSKTTVNLYTGLLSRSTPWDNCTYFQIIKILIEAGLDPNRCFYEVRPELRFCTKEENIPKMSLLQFVSTHIRDRYIWRKTLMYIIENGGNIWDLSYKDVIILTFF